MKLVVALGNPGTQYKKTRHNIGFVFLDSYLKDKNIKIKKNIRFNSEIAEIRTNKEKVFFVKPQNYMNNSGESVKKIMDYYNISIDQVLILVDDIYLDVGRIRLREKGGDGGHNGLKSIILNITNQFKRLRIGVGKNHQVDLDKHVLSKFNSSEIRLLKKLIPDINMIIEKFIDGINFVDIMSQFNKSE